MLYVNVVVWLIVKQNLNFEKYLLRISDVIFYNQAMIDLQVQEKVKLEWILIIDCDIRFRYQYELCWEQAAPLMLFCIYAMMWFMYAKLPLLCFESPAPRGFLDLGFSLFIIFALAFKAGYSTEEYMTPCSEIHLTCLHGGVFCWVRALVATCLVLVGVFDIMIMK